MDGLGIKVKTVDGNEVSYKLTPRVIVAFEQQYGKGKIGRASCRERVYSGV